MSLRQAQRRRILGEAWTDRDLVVDHRGEGDLVHPDVMSEAFRRIRDRAGWVGRGFTTCVTPLRPR